MSCFAPSRRIRSTCVALLVRRQRVDERMLRREDEVGRAEDRVGTRREDADVDCCAVNSPCPARDRGGAGELLEILHAERDLGAFGPADPVPLRLLGRLRPVEPVEVVEQAPGVLRDAEKPLLQEPLLDLGAAALALAGDDLLVGEDGLVVRAPVDRRALLVREARACTAAERSTASTCSSAGRWSTARAANRPSGRRASAGAGSCRCSSGSAPPGACPP